MNNNKLTDFQIGLRGQLTINLPVTIIILAALFLLDILIQKLSISLLVGTILGWLYWKFAAAKWVKWADKNNVDQERLYKIGKKGLLIWDREYIKNVIENNQKPWF